MNDQTLIRRANLRALYDSPQKLAIATGKKYTYCRDLLKTDTKSFGERAARDIEELLGLARGALDTPLENRPARESGAAIALQATERAAPYARPPWPFPQLSEAAICSMSPADRLRLEGALLAVIGQLGMLETLRAA